MASVQHLLQRQRLQETHPAQSHTIQVCLSEGPSVHTYLARSHSSNIPHDSKSILTIKFYNRAGKVLSPPHPPSSHFPFPNPTPSKTPQKPTNPSSQTPGLHSSPRQTPLRPQTIRLRRPNETRLPQESQDHEEDCAEAGMHGM